MRRRKQFSSVGRFIALEDRLTPATTATFTSGILSVIGDGKANNIVVSADDAGNILVTDKGTPVAITSPLGTATRASTVLIQVDGRGGNDTIVVERSVDTRDAGGLLVASPNAVLRGGGGNDAITPKHGGFLGGVIGAAIIGNVIQEGGGGNDTLTSGFGNDVMYGNGGNDTLIWLPGTLLDVYEGGAGKDNGVIVGNGNDQGDAFVLSAHPTSPGRVLFQRTNLINFFVDINGCEVITMNTQSGNDTVTINDLTGTAVRTVVVDTGVGDDVIDGTATTKKVKLLLTGGDGNDQISAGAGYSLIDGGAGNDILVGGANRDTILGSVGDDTISGGDGRDLIAGGDGADSIDSGLMNDKVSGGGGADIFVSPGKDLLLDLNAAEGDVTQM